MFVYEKKLQYPVRIKNSNPKLAAVIISQYGGPDGELGASLRYLSQRYSMPYPELKGLLTDIGTEESFLHTDRKPLQSLGFSGVGSDVEKGDISYSPLHTSFSSIFWPVRQWFVSRKLSSTKTHFWGRRLR